MTPFSTGYIVRFVTSRKYSSTSLFNSLHLSTDYRSLAFTQQSHALFLSLEFTQNPSLSSKLISAYSLCGSLTDAQFVFNALQLKNVFLWNTLITGYVKNHAYIEAHGLFTKMCCDYVLPDDYTLATLSKVSGELGYLSAGKKIHGKSVRTGFTSDCILSNSIMSMYGKCEEFGEMRKVFDEMPQRNVASWNVLISQWASSGDSNYREETWELIKCMQMQGLQPDGFSISSLLSLCIGERLNHGKELHGYIVRSGLDSGLGSDVHLGCCLIDMYSRTGMVDLATRVFDRMKILNVHAWTAMINGHALSEDFDKSLHLFRTMQVKGGLEPNRISLLSVLPACSSLARIVAGKQIHAYAIRKQIYQNTPFCNALINMYAKCGILNYARRLFDDRLFLKDAISWSSMISGYGFHGKGEEAVVLYNQMLQLGNKPDMISLVGVLSACVRSGLVNEGLRIYKNAIDYHGICPTLETCSCIVDMLGRSGKLDQAFEFIKTMPMQPGPSVWGALVKRLEPTEIWRCKTWLISFLSS